MANGANRLRNKIDPLIGSDLECKPILGDDIDRISDMGRSKILKIITWNVDGILEKRMEVTDFLKETDADILLISETHLKFDSYLKIPGYAIYHTTHPAGTARGGAAVIIKLKLQHYLDMPYKNNKFQVASITVKTYMGDIRVASLYSPPNNRIKKDDYISLFETLGPRFIIGGDFNAKHKLWGSRKTLTKGKELEKASIDLKLNFHSQGYPTSWPKDRRKKPDVIDFFVSKGISINCCDTYAIGDLSSDHIPVLLMLSSSGLLRIKNSPLFNEKTDWKQFRDKLNSIITVNAILSNEQCENEIQLLAIQIQNIVKSCTPPTKTMLYSLKIPKDVRELIRQRRKARATWHTTRYPGDKTILNKINKKLNSLLWNYKHESTKKFLKGLDNKPGTDYSLWKAIRYLKNTPIHSPPIRKKDGDWAKTEIEKAEVFAEHLANVFAPNEDIPGVNLEQLEKPEVIPNKKIALIKQEELLKEIKYKVKRRKSPGRDQIGGEILKQLPGNAITKLCSIFNYMLEKSYFPKVWKEAEIILIPKTGKDHTEPSSHRPISLLSVISKLWERLYLKRLKPILLENNAIPNHQFGFREKHSTTQQVHRVINLIEKTLEEKGVTAAIFLDIQMAFDRVWHQGLIFKLKSILPINHCDLINSYLSNRQFRVRYGSAYSEFKTILAGVPQGSVLGPILYLLFTRDVPESGKLLGTFADDIAALETGRDLPEATVKLQNTVDEVVSWTKDWRVALSNPKSVHTVFTNKKVNYIPILIENKPVPYSDSAKYLGVTIDRKLIWKHHIKNKREQLNAKYRQMYWLLGRNSALSIANKVLLYKQVLRPVWTYACELWGCTKPSNRYLIESFQAKVLRSMVDAPWFTTNESIREELGIESVSDYIKTASYKYYNKLEIHSNPLARDLTIDDPVRRLKRIKPRDLAFGV